MLTELLIINFFQTRLCQLIFKQSRVNELFKISRKCIVLEILNCMINKMKQNSEGSRQFSEEQNGRRNGIKRPETYRE